MKRHKIENHLEMNQIHSHTLSRTLTHIRTPVKPTFFRHIWQRFFFGVLLAVGEGRGEGEGEGEMEAGKSERGVAVTSPTVSVWGGGVANALTDVCGHMWLTVC